MNSKKLKKILYKLHFVTGLSHQISIPYFYKFDNCVTIYNSPFYTTFCVKLYQWFGWSLTQTCSSYIFILKAILKRNNTFKLYISNDYILHSNMYYQL